MELSEANKFLAGLTLCSSFPEACQKEATSKGATLRKARSSDEYVSGFYKVD